MLHARVGALVGAVSLAFCGATPNPNSPNTTTPTQREPDVVVDVSRSDQIAVLHRDQILGVPRPLDVEEWNVDYAANVLSLVSPPDVRRPGPDGWRFRGTAVGETDLALTEVPPRNVTGPPPAPRHFLVTVRVID